MKFRDLFKQQPDATALPREKPFQDIVSGIKNSVARLPGPMMVILIGALSIAIGLGIVMKIATEWNNKAEYLPLRISVDSNKPAVTAEQLRGTWLYDDDIQTMTMRFGTDVFELMQLRKGENYVRYYVRGGYRTEGDVLILQVRKDLGAPFEPMRQDMTFIPLEFDKMNVRIELANRIMLWTIPSSERAKFAESLMDDFPLTDKHPMPFVRIADQ